MDGSPSRGETIPIRLFLGGFDLTPTFRDVNKKFSTRYYLSLVLIQMHKDFIQKLDTDQKFREKKVREIYNLQKRNEQTIIVPTPPPATR